MSPDPEFTIYGRPYPAADGPAANETEADRDRRIAANHRRWEQWYRDRGYPADAGRCAARAERHEAASMRALTDVLG